MRLSKGVSLLRACAHEGEKTITPLTSPVLGPLSLIFGALFAPSPRLSDVLARIDATHPKLVAARAGVNAQRGKAREKRGAFDPVLTVGSDTLRYNTATDPGKPAESATLDGTVELATRSGLAFVAGSRLARGKIKSPTSATGLFESFVGLKMPLLRGAAGMNEKAVAERQAGLDVNLSEHDFDATRLQMRRDGAAAYWEWVASTRRLGIARNLLEIARSRAQAINDRFRLGDLPEVDVIEADGETQRRSGSLVKAERDLQKAAIKLSLYTWSEDGNPILPTVRFQPPELPPATDLTLIEETAALQGALRTRPELAGVGVVRQSQALSLDLARADRRPRFDLTLGPGYDVDGIGNTLKAGLLYSVPLRQNAADGRIAEAEAKLLKLEADRANLQGVISAEVGDAVSAVRTSYRRVLAAQTELDLAIRLERAERDRFDLGEGTIFLLNQRERARAETESRLVDVLAEYHAARSALRAAEGTL